MRAAAARCRVAIVEDHPIFADGLRRCLDAEPDFTAPPGSAIDVGAQVANDVVRLAVRDRGAGVDPAVALRLFTPFATTKPDGIGLGLALARDLTDAHGGTIGWRAAEPGTEFQLTLPRDVAARAQSSKTVTRADS